MSESRGASGTPKNTKNIKSPKGNRGNSDVPILNINSSDDEHIKPKTRVARKAEAKLILDHLGSNKVKCNRCRNFYKDYSDSDNTNRLRYRSMILKHLRTMHKLQVELTETLSPITQATSTNSLAWESEMEFPLEPGAQNTNPVERIQQNSIELLLNEETNGDQLRRENEERSEYENLSQCFTKRRKIDVPQIVTKNRFDPLQEPQKSDIEMDADDEATHNQIENTPTNTNTNRTQRTRTTTNNPPNEMTRSKTHKPPPIIISRVVQNKNNFDQMTKTLSKILTKGYNIKYTKNNTVINAKDMMEYRNYKKTLQGTTTEWHTYAAPEDRTHAFVIKGLDHRPDTENVKHELEQEHNINVKNIYIMETRYRPLYLVITTADHKLSTLKNKIRVLSNISIVWERRRQTSDILQCKRCCMWGHATTFCHRME